MRVFLALAGLALLCSPASAEILRVNARDLPAAIERAATGDTVIVEGGRFAGQLAVDKRISLVGVGLPVIDGREWGTVVRLQAAGIVFRGFRVCRSGARLLQDDAAILVTGRDVTIADNVIDEALHGIYVLRADGFRLIRNRIRGKAWLNDENRGNGIHLHASSDGRIEGNSIDTVRDGIYFNYADRILIVGNRASNLRYGLHYMFSNQNRFLDNEFVENVGGAALMYSHGITFERNTFARHRGFRAHGVLFKDVDNCVARGNRILDNSEGITLDGALNNRFEDNLVAGNDVAVVEYGNSEGNVFTRNGFEANGTDLRELAQQSASKWDENGRGNYWSSYAGYDLDGDGTGDVPYRPENLFDYLEGERPALRLLTFSPAADAVRRAEGAFPVLRQRLTLDRHPLMNVPPAVARLSSVGSRPGSARSSGSLLWAALAVLAFGVSLRGIGRRR